MGGLLKYDDVIRYRGRFTGTDMNDVPEYGIWELYDIVNVTHIPDIDGYGILEYIGTSFGFKVQKAYPRNNNKKAKIRYKSNSTSWTDWIEL